MNDLVFKKDANGKIVKVSDNKCEIPITWSEDADIQFCNFVLMIVLSARGIEKANGGY